MVDALLIWCSPYQYKCSQAGGADVQDTAKVAEKGIDRDFITLLPLE